MKKKLETTEKIGKLILQSNEFYERLNLRQKMIESLREQVINIFTEKFVNCIDLPFSDNPFITREPEPTSEEVSEWNHKAVSGDRIIVDKTKYKINYTDETEKEVTIEIVDK